MSTGEKTYHLVEIGLNEGQERFVKHLAQEHAKSIEVILQRLLNVGIVVMYERMKIEQTPRPQRES